MSAEKVGGAHKESFVEKVKKKGKEIVLFTAEKSVYVTLPLTAGLFAAGLLPFSTALLLGGVDIMGSKFAGKKRQKAHGH